jgi:signal transduction histidine kinase
MDVQFEDSSSRLDVLSRRRGVQLKCVVQDAVAQFSRAISQQNIEVTLDVPADIQLLADESSLASAIGHLVHNAIESMPAGGELVLTGYAGTSDVELEVADSGPSLEERTSATVSECAVDPQKDRLAICDRIAHMHGGRLTILNCPEGGAAFTLHIPTPQTAKAAA